MTKYLVTLLAQPILKTESKTWLSKNLGAKSTNLWLKGLGKLYYLWKGSDELWVR
jgi:hypothetical protein